MAKKIQVEGIFEAVRIVDEHDFKYFGRVKIFGWIRAFIDYCQIDKIGREILIENTSYKSLFVSSRFFIGELINIYFKRNSPNTQLIIFDDGIGSYIDRKLLTYSKRRRLVQSLVLGEHEFEMIEPQFLYFPDLYLLINGLGNKKIQRIKCNFNDKNITEMFNRIFAVDGHCLFSEKVMILDVLKEGFYNIQERKNLSDVYQLIVRTIGSSNTIIKKHPRDKDPEESNVKYYPDFQVPFECICMNTDCGNKVLISVSSTSVVTPKILLNQEPYVILLYWLVSPPNWTTQFRNTMDKFFQCCKNVYDQPERFLIPKTIKDLNDYLEDIADLIDKANS